MTHMTASSTLLAIGILCALHAGIVLGDTTKAVEAFKGGNYVEAERQARAAIARGEGRGYEVLAGLMMARTDREPDANGAIAVLEEARRTGWHRANVLLAYLLRTLGRSSGKVAEDESFALLLEAAKSPTSVEMEEMRVTGQQIHCEIGGRIENTLRSPQDAVAWYRRCADVGCSEGMRKLAGIYEAGSHGEKGDSLAAQRWRESARTAKPDGCSLQ